jgi:hypothetical protein
LRSPQRHTHGRPVSNPETFDESPILDFSLPFGVYQLDRPLAPACHSRLRCHSCRSSDFSGLLRFQPRRGLAQQHPWDSPASRGFPLGSSVTVAGSPPSWRSPDHHLSKWPVAPSGFILPRSVALIPPGWTNRARSPHGLSAPPRKPRTPASSEEPSNAARHVLGRLYRNPAHKERIPMFCCPVVKGAFCRVPS